MTIPGTGLQSLHELLLRPPLAESLGVLEYVSQDGDYCANFGDQWNRFRQMQIDSISGKTESHDRFFRETGWQPEELKGKLLLDAGCGAGRFSEVALEAGARVIAVDLSAAAWACRKTVDRFGPDSCLVLRASLFELPLPEQTFDGIYSLGVLQHTPDPLGAIGYLARCLRPGGRLATWVYEKRRPDLRPLQSRTWLRAVTHNWSDAAKLKLARALTAAFFPVGWAISWFGRTGERASQLLPYAARHHLGRGDLRRQWDYSVMDTYDWYGPVYDQPQTADDVMNAMRGAGLVNVRRLDARGMAIVGEAPR